MMGREQIMKEKEALKKQITRLPALFLSSDTFMYFMYVLYM